MHSLHDTSVWSSPDSPLWTVDRRMQCILDDFRPEGILYLEKHCLGAGSFGMVSCSCSFVTDTLARNALPVTVISCLAFLSLCLYFTDTSFLLANLRFNLLYALFYLLDLGSIEGFSVSVLMLRTCSNRRLRLCLPCFVLGLPGLGLLDGGPGRGFNREYCSEISFAFFYRE